MKKIIAFLMVLCSLSVNVFASDNYDDVKSYTQNLINDAIIKIFNKNLKTLDERVVPFRKVVNEDFDFDFIAKFVLGVYGRDVSQTQLDKFIKQFAELNVYSFAKKFEPYTDSAIEVISVKPGKKDNQYFVASKVLSQNSGDKDYSVDWRIIKSNDKYKVIDVIIEGVSMAMSYKNEYASILKQAQDAGKNPVEELTSKIEDTVIKLKLNK